MNLLDLAEAPDRANISWRPQPLEPIPSGVKTIYLDTETTGLKWSQGHRPIGASLYWRGMQGRYIPWGHRAGGNLPEEQVKRWMQQELRGKRIVNINTRFDIHMLREWGVDLRKQNNTVHDVAHYAALLDDSRKRFSLEILGQDYLGMGKIKGLDKTRMALYHASEVSDYAVRDVTLVADLDDLFRKKMIAEDLERVAALEDKLIYTVCSMEARGALLDLELLDRWIRETEVIVNSSIRTVSQEWGFQFSPTKTQDWVRVFRKYNLPIINFTDKGEPSFTDDVLKKHKDNPFIELARKAKKLMSLRSKFLLAYRNAVEEGGILRYSLNQLRADDKGTVSGRFSATDENIQQVAAPKKQKAALDMDDFIIRKLFIAPKRRLFFCSDAMQIEYRLFADYARNKRVLAAYAENPLMSFHVIVHDDLKTYLPELPYSRAKDCNFAKLYGAGKDKLAAMLALPLEEAEKVLQIYDTRFPEVKIMLRKASQLAKNRGYVHTLLGRRARFTGEQGVHKALNRVIQGTAADIMKTKLIELDETSPETGLELAWTVHDEADGYVPDEESARKVADVLNRQSFPNLKVPILWETGTGANWAEAKD